MLTASYYELFEGKGVTLTAILTAEDYKLYE